MENNLFGPFLGDKDVLEIIRQKSVGDVSLAALDCNWAGKNKINGEKEYFNIWAAVSFCSEKDRVFLQGARFSNWNVEFEMKFIQKAENKGLYGLFLNKPEEFPNEFVIRLERETGEWFYDNNNYRNYGIEHSKGHFASAVAQNGLVFSFDSIIQVHICSTH